MPADEISKNIKAARDRRVEWALKESGLLDKILEADKKNQESKKVKNSQTTSENKTGTSSAENTQVNKTDMATDKNLETATESKTDTPTNEKSVDREVIEAEIKSMSGARSGTGLSKKIRGLILGCNVNLLAEVPIDKLKVMLDIVKVWATEIDGILQGYGVKSIRELSKDKQEEVREKVAEL